MREPLLSERDEERNGGTTRDERPLLTENGGNDSGHWEQGNPHEQGQENRWACSCRSNHGRIPSRSPGMRFGCDRNRQRTFRLKAEPTRHAFVRQPAT